MTSLFKNDKMCENVKNKNAYFIQVLVQNYLEHELAEKGTYYLYGELINDIDVFSKNIMQYAKIRQKLSSQRPSAEAPHIEAFLDLVEGSSYLYSYDVKYAAKKYMYQFQHIYQIISRIKYPSNTTLQIIVVPSERDLDESVEHNISTFEEYKQKILSLAPPDKKLIFNTFANDKSFSKDDASDVLMRYYQKALRKTLKTTFGAENDICDDDAKMLEYNFSKLTIRILRVNELLKYPLTPEFIKNTLDI